MGDRINIIVKQGNGDPPVYVYSHWGGNTLANGGGIEKAIEAAKDRIGDPHYFTALFIESIHEQGLLSGVGTSTDDENHPPVTVDAITGKREDGG